MKPLLPALLALTFAVPVAAGEPVVNGEKLLSRLRPVYSQPTSFWPAALRFPLRLDPGAELGAAKKAAAELAGVETQRQVALLAEQAEDPDATDHWSAALETVEAALKRKPGDTTLLEQQVEAMIGADHALQVVPAAEKLAGRAPGNWRWQLLLGDAHLRRADYNWRVLTKIAQGAKALPAPQLIQLNGDLAAAETSYARAVELAPAEAAPRAGRMTLSMARPVMASMLPVNAVAAPKQAPLVAIVGDLVELVRRNPSLVTPVWHTAHFLALQPLGETAIAGADRELVEKAAGQLKPDGAERVFVLEARGLLAVARHDWTTARQEFAAAVAARRERSFAADWLGLAEVNSNEPRDQVIARVRARLAIQPSAADWTVLGMLLCEGEPRPAVDAFRKAIALDVDRATPRYNLAVLLARSDAKSPEILFHLGRVLEIQPDDREARFAMAVVNAAAGRLDPARRTLKGIQGIPDLEPDLRKRVEETLADLGSK